jgi:dihydroorotase
MSASLAIEGARLVDPATGRDEVAGVYIADGRIAAIGARPSGFQAQRTLDGRGLVVAPGLVDLCARMREPGTEGALRGEMRAALAGGVTGVVCPPDTHPPLDEPGLVRMLRQRSREAAGARLYPLGALTAGLAGEALAEMHTLSQVGCVAFAQTGALLANRGTLLQAMRYAKTFDLPVWLRPVDETLVGDGVAGDGPMASRLGLPGIPVAAETVALHTIFALQRASGARIHICRISSGQGVELVRAAKREGLRVSADVCIHHVRLSDANIGDYDTSCRLDPPLRAQEDRDEIRAGLRDGTIDAICSDHAPVSLEDKLLPFGEARAGATGLETLLPLVLEWAMEDRIDLVQALSFVTSAPARILGEDTGTLQVGRKADLVVFDPKARWTVDANSLVSSGVNSPYTGDQLTGRARWTLVGGEVRHESSQNSPLPRSSAGKG